MSEIARWERHTAEKSHKRAPDWPSWADFVCWTALERIGYLGVREFNAG
jgi:hypothetical protein